MKPAVPEVAAAGSLDGRYTFRRVFPGHTSQAFRQTFDLVIDHDRATLHIVTMEDLAPRSNEDLDQATFDKELKTHDETGTATQTPDGELALVLSDGTKWICRRLEVRVSPRDATLTRPASDDSCRQDSLVEPATTTSVLTLSCRGDGSDVDGPPPLRGDASRERRRDSDRWTFAPEPGVELLRDTCPARTGILRIRR